MHPLPSHSGIEGPSSRYFLSRDWTPHFHYPRRLPWTHHRHWTGRTRHPHWHPCPSCLYLDRCQSHHRRRRPLGRRGSWSALDLPPPHLNRPDTFQYRLHHYTIHLLLPLHRHWGLLHHSRCHHLSFRLPHHHQILFPPLLHHLQWLTRCLRPLEREISGSLRYQPVSSISSKPKYSLSRCDVSARPRLVARWNQREQVSFLRCLSLSSGVKTCTEGSHIDGCDRPHRPKIGLLGLSSTKNIKVSRQIISTLRISLSACSTSINVFDNKYK